MPREEDVANYHRATQQWGITASAFLEQGTRDAELEMLYAQEDYARACAALRGVWGQDLECDACQNRPGAPELCYSCRERRRELTETGWCRPGWFPAVANRLGPIPLPSRPSMRRVIAEFVSSMGDQSPIQVESEEPVLFGPDPANPGVMTNLSEVRFPPAGSSWGSGPLEIRLADGTVLSATQAAAAIGTLCQGVVQIAGQVGALLAELKPQAPPERRTRFDRTTPFDDD